MAGSVGRSFPILDVSLDLSHTYVHDLSDFLGHVVVDILGDLSLELCVLVP